MKITYQRLIDYTNVAYYFLRKKKENADTKLGYAITRMGKVIDKALRPYKELIEEQNIAVEDINILNATTDKTTGVLVFDTAKDEAGKEIRNYRYTPEKLIKRNKEIRAIAKEYEAKIEALLEQEAELVNPYFATDLPNDLTTQEIEAFDGIVLERTSINVKATNGVEKALAEA